jgi:hypothetical protein
LTQNEKNIPFFLFEKQLKVWGKEGCGFLGVERFWEKSGFFLVG